MVVMKKGVAPAGQPRLASIRSAGDGFVGEIEGDFLKRKVSEFEFSRERHAVAVVTDERGGLSV